MRFDVVLTSSFRIQMSQLQSNVMPSSGHGPIVCGDPARSDFWDVWQGPTAFFIVARDNCTCAIRSLNRGWSRDETQVASKTGGSYRPLAQPGRPHHCKIGCSLGILNSSHRTKPTFLQTPPLPTFCGIASMGETWGRRCIILIFTRRGVPAGRPASSVSPTSLY